jgi:hypothetical protein
MLRGFACCSVCSCGYSIFDTKGFIDVMVMTELIVTGHANNRLLRSLRQTHIECGDISHTRCRTIQTLMWNASLFIHRHHASLHAPSKSSARCSMASSTWRGSGALARVLAYWRRMACQIWAVRRANAWCLGRGCAGSWLARLPTAVRGSMALLSAHCSSVPQTSGASGLCFCWCVSGAARAHQKRPHRRGRLRL